VKRNQIKKHVKKRYSGLAKGKTSSCSSCCPCDYDAVEQSKAIGYSITDIEQIPKEAVKGLGCGNPTALADLIEGETVLDLGAGLGIDVAPEAFAGWVLAPCAHRLPAIAKTSIHAIPAVRFCIFMGISLGSRYSCIPPHLISRPCLGCPETTRRRKLHTAQSFHRPSKVPLPRSAVNY